MDHRGNKQRRSNDGEDRKLDPALLEAVSGEEVILEERGESAFMLLLPSLIVPLILPKSSKMLCLCSSKLHFPLSTPD